jgi:hypothetical protein
MYCLVARTAPATATETRNVPAAPRLQITIEETTHLVAAGTVYRSVDVVAAGAD